MKRSTPLKRTPFKRVYAKPAHPENEGVGIDDRADYVSQPRTATMARALQDRTPVVLPKPETFEHEPYRRLVAALPCAMCGRAGPSQHCHMDLGKGTGLKTDDRLAWPGCADGPGYVGCHTQLCATGVLPKAMRRHKEALLVINTIWRINTMGLWPGDVPALPADAVDMLRQWAQ